eukprot:9503898-Pyramimonas_sp.AAC.1
MDAKGNHVDAKGKCVDVKGDCVDVKGKHVDVTGNNVDVQHTREADQVQRARARNNTPDVSCCKTRVTLTLFDLWGWDRTKRGACER